MKWLYGRQLRGEIAVRQFFKSAAEPVSGEFRVLRNVFVRFLIAGAAGVAVIWLGVDRLAAEKIATALLMPTGLLWLMLLFFASYFVALRQRSAAVVMMLLWMFLSVAGNSQLSSQLAWSLERQWLNVSPLDPEQTLPFDVIVVAGGGASAGANGRIQGNGSGDRLILAAQMYHAGLTKKIICTGQRIASMDATGIDPADASVSVLEQLGVPADQIQTLGGRNTSEEIQGLAQQIGNSSERIGLLTSAWHLRRALSLAHRAGLDLVGVPADFRSPVSLDNQTPGQMLEAMIPSAGVISANTAMLKEYLALLAGR